MRGRDIDRLMRKFGGDDGLYRIADKYGKLTWQEGNCWTFARALQLFFDRGELWAACLDRSGHGRPSHIYLKLDGHYLDSRGRHTEAGAIRDHLEMWTVPVRLFMRPLAECGTDDITPCIPNEGVNRMVRRMRKLARRKNARNRLDTRINRATLR